MEALADGLAARFLAAEETRRQLMTALNGMREGVVREAFEKPVDSVASALRFLAADRYVQERREILAGLNASGILTLDATAKEFPVALANCYFDIKAAGRI